MAARVRAQGELTSGKALPLTPPSPQPFDFAAYFPKAAERKPLELGQVTGGTLPRAPALGAGVSSSTEGTGRELNAPGSGLGTSGAGAGVGGGGGSGKVVMPEPASMTGLKQAAEGAEMVGGGAGASVSGPSRFRQGIGSRIPPRYSAALAALRQVY